MSQFKRVTLPTPLGDRGSQTFLRHFNLCPRSGYLYAVTRGQVRTVDMMRGSAGHAILERSTRAALDADEPVIPPDVVKAITDEVLADPEYPVPLEEHDYLRELAWRWGEQTMIDLEHWVACETLFTLDVGGFAVRCKVDYATFDPGKLTLGVVDYKTGRGAPAWEDVARKLPDGRLMAKSFQLVLYALVLVYGVPVRVESCAACRDGWVASLKPGGPNVPMVREDCPECGGSGRVETPEPFPVASRAQHLNLEYVYPGIEDREGKMLRRPLTLSRAELEQYRHSLHALIVRVREAEATGDWPAVVSDAACDQCPAPPLCPIPAELRDHRGSVNTVEQAAEAFTVRYREKKEQRAKARELREFIKHHGSVRYGNGMVAEIAYSEHEEVFDKAGLDEAVQRAVRYGEPFERWRYIRTKGSNRLVERELTADELLESEGSDGSSNGAEAEGQADTEAAAAAGDD